MENAKIRNESSISISLSLMAATSDVRVCMVNCILYTMSFLSWYSLFCCKRQSM